MYGQSNQYARWALDQGLAKGDVVCLLMSNRPEYMAIWLGITSVGVVVSLLNTHLEGPSLAHCIRVVSPKCVIVAAELVDTLTTALSHVDLSTAVWTYCAEGAPFPSIDLAIACLSGESLPQDARRGTSINDLALHIYTSGTTGLPKAANVSHARVMQWSHWFSGMMDVMPADRMYSCLPMYHSVGGVQAPGAVLVVGGAVVIREKFSASQFWTDIVRWDCTLLQYIGELCRYLLHAAPVPDEAEHRIRLACGSSWRRTYGMLFKDRFRIPRILEFYAATEGAVSLFNVQGKRGAIGHIPAYLAHRFSPALVMLDVETGEPARNERGFCIRCAPNQAGEAISKVANDPANIGSRFEGYTNKRALRRRFSATYSGDWGRLDPYGRPDPEGRARVLLLRRSHRRHLSPEGRERCHIRSLGSDLLISWSQARQRVRRCSSECRRPCGHGGPGC